MDSLWTHYGLIMNQLRTQRATHYGLIMDSLWTHYGLIMDSLAVEPNGLSMDSLWTHYGLIMTQLRTHYELIMDSLWTYCGLIKNSLTYNMDSLWTHYELIVDSLWTISPPSGSGCHEHPPTKQLVLEKIILRNVFPLISSQRDILGKVVSHTLSQIKITNCNITDKLQVVGVLAVKRQLKKIEHFHFDQLLSFYLSTPKISAQNLFIVQSLCLHTSTL